MFVYVDGVWTWNPVGSQFYWVFCDHTQLDEFREFLPDGVRGAWWGVWEVVHYEVPHYYRWTFDHFALLEEGSRPPFLEA